MLIGPLLRSPAALITRDKAVRATATLDYWSYSVPESGTRPVMTRAGVDSPPAMPRCSYRETHDELPRSWPASVLRQRGRLSSLATDETVAHRQPPRARSAS